MGSRLRKAQRARGELCRWSEPQDCWSWLEGAGPLHPCFTGGPPREVAGLPRGRAFPRASPFQNACGPQARAAGYLPHPSPETLLTAFQVWPSIGPEISCFVEGKPLAPFLGQAGLSDPRGQDLPQLRPSLGTEDL